MFAFGYRRDSTELNITLDCNTLYIFAFRKYAIYVSSITACIGTLLMALSTVGKSYEMLFVGRTVNGLALGTIY